MKKIAFLLLVLLLTGCKATHKNFLEKMSKNYEEITQYYVNGEIQIYHSDSSTKYEFETYYLDPSFVKVCLTNTNNNSKQIVIKNESGVFVLSPLINKTFKFPSTWPDDNSTPYVVSSLITDIINDSTMEIIENEDNFLVKCSVSNKINLNLNRQEITFDKKTLLPTTVKVFDKNDTLKLDVLFNGFDLNIQLSKGDFDVDSNMTSLILEISEGVEMGEFSLPTYAPYDVIKTERRLDDAIIISYTGDKSYTIYQRYKEDSNMIDDIRNYDSYVLLNNTIAVVSSNSIKWNYAGIEYSIYSDTLEIYELIDIANSIV